MKDLRNSLSKGFGLEEHESGIYVALLSLGGSNVTEVSKKSGVKRTTAYYYLEALIERGLLYKSVKGKRTHYFPVDPKELPRLIAAKEKIIFQTLPYLSELYEKSFVRPIVRFYEGREGIKNLYREILDTHQTIYSVFSPQSFYKTFTESENHEFLMLVKENGAELHNLVEIGQYSKLILRRQEYKSFVKSKPLPEGFTSSTDLLVTKNKVVHISFDKLVGTLVEDEAIANLQRNFFKFLWRQI